MATRGYPRTRFQIIDQTHIPELPVDRVYTNAAVQMVAFTSDKGPEGWSMLSGLENFTNAYGGISFEKHGQAQLTIAETLRAGGYIFGKRMVSSDATLANITVHARVVKTDGVSYVYTYVTSAEGVTTMNEAAMEGYGNYDFNITDATDFPLFTIGARGRGASSIYITIEPEYSRARSANVIRYSMNVYEGDTVLENIVFSINPEYILDEINQSVQSKINTTSIQLQCMQHVDGIYGLARCVLETATMNGEAIDNETLMAQDFLNGLDRRGGATLGGIVSSGDTGSIWELNKPADIEYVALNNPNGIYLANGSYGTMGFAPIENQVELTKLLLGSWGANTKSDQYDPIIYDLDAYKPDVILDANYPVSVKNAIIDVCDFRQDVVFFADLGLLNDDLQSIVDASYELKTSRFCAVYHNYFKIINPYTKKEVTVTLPYLLASRFVKHVDNGVARAFAGIPNGMTFPEIITGTLNFIPYITPASDQKQVMADNCINYISYYDGVPVLETCYVNYEEYTQLSFLQNILAVQEVIKAVRSNCPKTRYAFLDNESLDNYIEDANRVINQFQSNFQSISMEYLEDEIYEANNIFYAAITVKFHNFVQEELFKVICIS